MWNKYCKKDHSSIAKARRGSQIWKKMVEIREEVQQQIWWQLKAENSDFWLDNWTQQGAMYFTEEREGEQEWGVNEFIQGGEWDVQRQQALISAEMVDHIISDIKPVVEQDDIDLPLWMPSSDGKFSTKSTYEILNERAEERLDGLSVG